jgi:hypothetical protein
LAKAGFMTFQVIPLGYPSFLENLFVTEKRIAGKTS